MEAVHMPYHIQVLSYYSDTSSPYTAATSALRYDSAVAMERMVGVERRGRGRCDAGRQVSSVR